MIVYFFILSLSIAAGLYWIRHKILNYVLLGVFQLGLIGLNVDVALNLNKESLGLFKPDTLSLIFLTVLSIVSSTSIFHYVLYSQKRRESTRERALQYTGFVLFITSITCAMLTNHVGAMWAFMEATTLCAAVLIYHDKSVLSLEATWKYIFVCSIGIAFAFIGILFLSMAANEVHIHSITFDEIYAASNQMTPSWLMATFLLILTGFSVKFGIVPLFNVDIDAKDESPSPIGALFSSGLMNMGFIAIFRFYSAFSNTNILPWMNNLLLITGGLSIFFAAVYILKVRNIKRLFAYSSTEHAGLVAIALSMGGPGYFAAILHLIIHSFTKASMFYQVMQIYDVYGSKQIDKLGNYFKYNPMGGIILLFSLISITAMPPSGLFISEFMIFKAMFFKGYWVVAVCIMILLSFIIYFFTKVFLQVIFTAKDDIVGIKENIKGYESITQVFLLSLVFYLGFVQPDFLVELINRCVEHLP